MELEAHPGQQAQHPEAATADLLEQGVGARRGPHGVRKQRPPTGLEPQPSLNPGAEVLQRPVGQAPIPELFVVVR
eukprot:9879125-Alexandrium_andersonii.AAC.1